MRVKDLIQLSKNYLSLGLIIALLIVGIFLFIYKKYMKKNNITIGKIIWMMVFCSYIVMILSATLFDRGQFFKESSIIPFMYSYKDAWIHASARAWRNIIFNILAFVPLGFLLPLGFKKLDRFWKVYCIGFLLTVLIECIQLFSGCGIFEVDDMINNLLGTMIGYGGYRLIFHSMSYIKKSKNKKYRWRETILLQIPLFLVVISAIILYTAYSVQELGNVSIQGIGRYKEGKLTVKSDRNFEDMTIKKPVYKCKIYSKKEAEEFAREMFEKLGVKLEEEESEFYQDEALFCADSRYRLWFYYKGGGYSLIDFDTIDCQKIAVDEEKIREDLLSYYIKIPDYAKIEYNKEGEFSFTMKKAENGTINSNGFIKGKYCGNGKFSDLVYNLIQYEYYDDFDMISPKEAYKNLCDGKFNWHEKGDLNINVEGYEIKYIQDTKGFYQPYYSFLCKVNGKEREIPIMGIK